MTPVQGKNRLHFPVAIPVMAPIYPRELFLTFGVPLTPVQSLYRLQEFLNSFVDLPLSPFSGAACVTFFCCQHVCHVLGPYSAAAPM